MNIDPKKVIDAIIHLTAAAESLTSSPDEAVKGFVAAECLRCAAALKASAQIAGLQTIQTVGSLQ